MTLRAYWLGHRSTSFEIRKDSGARSRLDALTLRGVNLSIEYCLRAGVAQW